jgi:hypothetical protein
MEGARTPPPREALEDGIDGASHDGHRPDVPRGRHGNPVGAVTDASRQAE